MRRPHRSIETFDISLMAVVTKAMGAFLVLMLLLLPYYTPDPKEDDTKELIKQLKLVAARVDEVSRQLDPASGAGNALENLKTLSEQAKLSAEVIAKLEGLINKAFSEVTRLESLNRQLENENAELRAEIEELKRELEKLREEMENKGRAVIASVSVKGCNDVWLDPYILRVGGEGTFVWTADQEKIKPEYIFNVGLGTEGGSMYQLPNTQSPTYPDRAPFRNFASYWTSRMFSNLNVGAGEYAIILIKKDNTKSWTLEKRNWQLIRRSAQDCDLTLTMSARIAETWSARPPLTTVMTADAFGGIVLAFTSDDDGITVRAPTESEIKWFDDLMARTIKVQERIPEARPFSQKAGDSPRSDTGPPAKKEETPPEDRTTTTDARIKALEEQMKQLPPGEQRDNIERTIKQLREGGSGQ